MENYNIVALDKIDIARFLQEALKKRRQEKNIKLAPSKRRLEQENRIPCLSTLIRYLSILELSSEELVKRFANAFLHEAFVINSYLEEVSKEVTPVVALLKLLKFVRIQAKLTQVEVAWRMGFEGNNSRISPEENGIGNPYFSYFFNFLLACDFSEKEIKESLLDIITK